MAGKIDEYETTRARMLQAVKTSTAAAQNDVAWTAALAKDTPEGAEQAVKLAEMAVSVSPRNADYLTTYGAVLYRAGERKKAIEQLQNATKQRAQPYYPPDRKAYGDALDKLFIAMAQYTPEQPEEARRTLESAIQTINKFKSAQRSESPDQSLTRVWYWLEFKILQDEAKRLIHP
jgi:tetratricopeptide (TPR) repeat protein